MIKFTKGHVVKTLFVDLLDSKKKFYLMHICNNKNMWGAGFTHAISRVCPDVEKYYREGFNRPGNMVLGCAQVVKTPRPNLFVVNLIAQDGIGTTSNNKGEQIPPIRYPALTAALVNALKYIVDNSAPEEDTEIHAPLMGTGLAGGDWNTIAALIEGTIGNYYEVMIHILSDDPRCKVLIQG